MELYLKNIGKISESLIEINGITVITGNNNTGKSTVGKTLFTIFESLYDIERKVLDEKIDFIKDKILLIDNFLSDDVYINKRYIDSIIDNIISNYEYLNTNTYEFKKYVLEPLYNLYCNDIDSKKNDRTKDLIYKLLEDLYVPNEDIIKRILQKNLNNIFNQQVTSVLCESFSEIKLKLKNEHILINLDGNSNILKFEHKTVVITDAIYIDNPLILDQFNQESKENISLNYNKSLLQKLFFTKQNNIIDELSIENKLKSIYKKINLICSGKIIGDEIKGFNYTLENTEKTINIKNLSIGIKTFAILKMLLENGALKYNGIIILDEPEIHLHPEWQLLFAEIIVLLNKEFNMHILLTTHSPYFLNAIEVYSKKYKLENQTKYYLASNNKNGTSRIKDVSNNIEEIYKKLAKPFQTLENMEYAEDEN